MPKRIIQIWVSIMLMFSCKMEAQTTSSCIEIQSILVDACAPLGGEEMDNEMLRFLVGPNPLNINNMSMTYGYFQSFSGIQAPNVSTESKVAALNASILSCGFLIEPENGILPANAKVIWISSILVSNTANTFANLSDTLYVIFGRLSFNSDAYFINYAPSNTTPAPDNITVTVSFGGSCSDQVTYFRPSLVTQSGFPGAQDGATVNFSFSGTPTYVNNGCSAPVTSFSANWNSPGTVCDNSGPVSLTQFITGTSGGTFSGNGVSNNTFNPAGLSGAIQITYTVGTGGSCPPISQTKTINVVPAQTASWSLPAPVCQGSSVDLAALITGPTGGTWSGQGVSGTSFNSAGLTGQIPVTYTLGAGTPCQSVSTQNIQVITAGNATWSPPANICNTAPPVELSTGVSGTPGGTWSGTGVSTSGSFNPSGLSGSIEITYTVGSGSCTASSTQNIQVIQGGDPTWTAPAALCSNNPAIDLTTQITGTTGGTWSGNGVSASGIFNPSGLNGSVAITYTVGSGACQTASTQNIQVTASGNAQWSAPASICNTAPALNLAALVTGNPGGTWSGNGVNAAGLFNPSGLNGNQTITYSVGSGSCAASESKTINVAPAPLAPQVSGQTAYCTGEPFTAINATGVSGAIFRWYSDASLNNLLTSANSFSPGSSTPSIIYVTQEVTGCTSPATPVNLTINPRPETPAVQSPLSYCAGAALPILNAVGAGGSLNWYTDQGLTNLLGTGDNVPITSPGLGNYYVVETSAAGCRSLPGTVQVIEQAVITAEITPPGPLSICNGEPVVLTSSSSTDNLWSTGETSQSIVVNNVGTITLTVSGTCNSATDQVEVQPADVDAMFSLSVNSGFAPLTVDIINESTGSSSCAWFLNDVPSSEPETGSLVLSSPGNYSISLECVSASGCIDRETQFVNVNPGEVTFWVPNTFTPNGDGKNEIFYAYGIGIEKLTGAIFDRWGVKIYEWKGLDAGWDGTVDGRVVQDGIFAYRFDVVDTNGKKFRRTGKILVLQNNVKD